MGMDKNTVIGFVLIGLLLMGMLYINSKSSHALQVQRQHEADSIAALMPKQDTAAARRDSILQINDIKDKAQKSSGIISDSLEKLTTLENEVLKITFTNKGAQPKIVELKNYKTNDGKPLILQNSSFNKIAYKINAGNSTVYTNDLNFSLLDKKLNADKSQTISYSLKDAEGKALLTHQFILKDNDYMIDFNVIADNPNKLFTQNDIHLLWQTEAPQLEKTITYEKTQTHICYINNGKYDFTVLGKGGNEKFEKPVDWIAVNPQFFVTTLIAKDKFKTADVTWVNPTDSLKIVAQTTANCEVNIPANGIVPLQLYYGPNDYKVLDKYNNNMHQIVTYGGGPFSFVKYINRHLLLPIWDFIRGHIASYGLVILLLTLLIRLITSPILYKSYLSSAKMKVLKPEIDALKAKYVNPKTGELDQQAFSVAQMQFTKSAGVNMLGGCLPALLQIPIFMSLYYFFQSNISLRGQNFLWAKDLAAYDSIYQLPFNIPFYGDHVSLFTLTATITSLLISVYSMSNMQDNSNPVMKYMPYIFPIFLLGIFNNLPSALTWYYTISNSITLILQIVIQKYIINHDKILTEINENRKKPVKQNKLQERIAAMQESQKKIQELKNKTSK